MSHRRTYLLAAALLPALAALVLLFLNREPMSRPLVPAAAAAASSPAAAPETPAKPAATATATAAATAEPPSPLANELNAPHSTIQRDLAILNDLFLAWQTNFPHEGNPVGDNVEITQQLTGRNRLGFQFVRADHPAINAKGELCDRWGTPFFFHALSSARVEIRSAGTDREIYTEDDVVYTP
ncbi:MAG: hypothetical protein HZA31_11460 [Opitutae bacterium]|nr:hypothetical protein [Opitutae bacterium]